MMAKGLPEVWHELRRRKLVQWSLAYLAGAWAVLEVFDLVGSQFGWPSLLMRSFTISLGLGFLLMLVLAWYHGERGEQKVSGTELLVLAVLLSMCAGLMWRYTRMTQPVAEVAQSPGTTQPATDQPAATITAKSVAVLPFTNVGGDQDQQYFSDGLSEDLITALSQFGGLKVISRKSAFQFRGSKDTSKVIGDKLGVAHLLEGSVRRAGNTVRISARLVKAADGSTVWSQRYDRPYRELFTLQDEITTAVAGALEARLKAEEGAVIQSDRPPSGNVDAYNAYLQGRFHSVRWTLQDAHAAIEQFDTAIRLDPRYAAAYAELSFTWFLIGMKSRGVDMQDAFGRARAAAAAALALDPELAKAHLVQAVVLLRIDFDLAGAQAENRRAAELAPHDAEVKFQMSVQQATLGHTRQAVVLARQSLATDPLSAGMYDFLSAYLMALGRLDEAEQAIKKSIALQPTVPGAPLDLARIAILRGDAETALRLARQEPGPSASSRIALAQALQIGPDRVAADAALQLLIDTDASRNAHQIAQVYALRQQPDEAFAWLDRAWRQRDPSVTELLFDPFLLRYKDDPRFAAFCKQVGLPVPDSPAPASP